MKIVLKAKYVSCKHCFKWLQTQLSISFKLQLPVVTCLNLPKSYCSKWTDLIIRSCSFKFYFIFQVTLLIFRKYLFLAQAHFYLRTVFCLISHTTMVFHLTYKPNRSQRDVIQAVTRQYSFPKFNFNKNLIIMGWCFKTAV